MSDNGELGRAEGRPDRVHADATGGYGIRENLVCQGRGAPSWPPSQKPKALGVVLADVCAVLGHRNRRVPLSGTRRYPTQFGFPGRRPQQSVREPGGGGLRARNVDMVPGPRFRPTISTWCTAG